MDTSAVWTQVVSLSVVPVVIISACGLLCLTFYNRLAFLVGRLRSLQRERIELLQLEKENKVGALLAILEEQTKDVFYRAELLRCCLFSLISAIAALILTSLCAGLSVLHPTAGYVGLFLFILGLFLVFLAMVYAFLEMKRALLPIRAESEAITELFKRK